MRLLQFNQFKPIELADRPVIQNITASLQTPVSHFNFAALYCWQEYYQTLWQLKNSKIFILNAQAGILLMPPGPDPLFPDELAAASQMLREQGFPGGIALIDLDYPEKFPEINKYFKLIKDRDNGDYIYRISSLVALKGKKLRKKKNQINQFFSTYPDYHTRVMDHSEWPLCLKLAETWSRSQLKMPLNISDEFRALQRAFLHCSQLELTGIGLFVGHRLVAFAIFSQQNRDTATVHFEKFDPMIKGASQMINRETALYLRDRYTFINREQDLGIPGLRRAKESWEPEEFYWGYMALPL